MSNHIPSLQFYPADWIKDPALQRCKYETKGMWIDIICYLHESSTRGKITATRDEWCRLIGCTAKEFNDFLAENKQKKFADISERNGNVTIKNRRMYRDEKARQQTRERVRKHRSNAHVTHEKRESNAYSSSSSSSSDKSTKVLFTEGAIEYQLAALLLDLIIKNNPKAKQASFSPSERAKYLGGWANDIDKMLRLDRRHPTDIEAVIRFCQQDAFWKTNILSAKKLREKFDQLYVKMDAVQNRGEEQARGRQQKKQQKRIGWDREDIRELVIE